MIAHRRDDGVRENDRIAPARVPDDRKMECCDS